MEPMYHYSVRLLGHCDLQALCLVQHVPLVLQHPDKPLFLSLHDKSSLPLPFLQLPQVCLSLHHLGWVFIKL